GIASGGTDRTAAEDLVLQAQTAMHRSCKTTGQQCEIFDDRMRAVALGRLETEAALRRAVEESSFCLHYQPIVSLKTGHACGLEALVRWERDGHLVYPADFIPIAEDTGLIIPLERWV